MHLSVAQGDRPEERCIMPNVTWPARPFDPDCKELVPIPDGIVQRVRQAVPDWAGNVDTIRNLLLRGGYRPEALPQLTAVQVEQAIRADWAEWAGAGRGCNPTASFNVEQVGKQRAALLLGAQGAGAEGLDAGNKPPLTGVASPKQLADEYHVGAEQTRAALNRWRKRNAGGDGYTEDPDARQDEPRFLYKRSVVRHVMEAMQQRVARRTKTSGQRPAKNP
jgi:hypothetical protein